MKYDYDDMSKYIKLPDFKNHTFELDENQIKLIIGGCILEKAQENRVLDSGYKCKRGDAVQITYSQYFIDEAGNAEKEPFDDEISVIEYIGANFDSEIENLLINMAVGEEKEAQLTYPIDEKDKDLAGKKVLFKVKSEGIFIPPAYNDSFVRTYFPKISTTKELEESLKAECLSTLIEDYIRDNSEVLEYPSYEYCIYGDQFDRQSKICEKQMGTTFEKLVDEELNITREEYIKANMKIDMINYTLSRMIGDDAVPSECELAKTEAILNNGYYRAGMSESEWTEHIYYCAMIEKISKILPSLVKVKLIPATQKYIWETE